MSFDGYGAREWAMRKILLDDAREIHMESDDLYFDLVFDLMNSGLLFWVTEDNGTKVPSLAGPNGAVKIFKPSRAPQSSR